MAKPQNKQTNEYLNKVINISEESDRDTDESTESHGGFRPRLTRVKEGTGRSLFGKPVSQSTRQSRGSGGLLIKETYFMICS